MQKLSKTKTRQIITLKWLLTAPCPPNRPHTMLPGVNVWLGHPQGKLPGSSWPPQTETRAWSQTSIGGAPVACHGAVHFFQPENRAEGERASAKDAKEIHVQQRAAGLRRSDCWENDHGLKDFLLFPLEIVCRPAVDGINKSHLTKSWNHNVGDRPYKASTERETAARRSAGEASQVCSFEEPTTNVMMPAHHIQYTISAW